VTLSTSIPEKRARWILYISDSVSGTYLGTLDFGIPTAKIDRLASL